jgi:acyl-coenzyme A thioesterase PaaI-like protein
MTTTVNDEPGAGERRHVLQDLGWTMTRSADTLHGRAMLVPQMQVPGTGCLRLSILAIWADIMAGTLAASTIHPRVPVTLELDVHLYVPPPGAGAVQGRARIVKSGRSVFVASVDFTSEDDEAIGFAAASFMPAPDARLTFETPLGVDRPGPAATTVLSVPFAERAGCTRSAPGEAVLARSDQSLNAANTLNGGLIALAAEEAALSLAPGLTLASLDLRYLQPVRIGPAVARADLRDGLGRVEVHDAGNEERLCVVATCRTFGP